MAKKPLPTPEQLRQLLRYEPETGKLFWRERDAGWFKGTDKWTAEAQCRRWNSEYAGKEAFTHANAKGYKVGSILSVMYRAHRVIWKMMTGAEPVDEIDHINRDASDNRWCNLREANRLQNGRNVSSSKNASSRYLGVHRQRNGRRWVACIRIGGKTKHLGVFDEEQDAAAAYDNAARSERGEFASLNFAVSEVFSEPRTLP